MGFGGSVAAMIASLKNNKRDRTTLYDKDKKGKNASGSSYGAFVDHKKMSPEEFKAFQQKLKEKKKAETKRQLILFGVIVLVVVAFVSYFLYFFPTK
ncbi:MAG: hypothetical protein CMC74_12420 [Flavobacteriaceae bacterium]|nr:hypothetical protein [Flavobacteriaceae bacterium]|tara:strand:+ start:52224 stop:52514 length:291 start_codon:yes stop_codon:yes gene_type:complete